MPSRCSISTGTVRTRPRAHCDAHPSAPSILAVNLTPLPCPPAARRVDRQIRAVRSYEAAGRAWTDAGANRAAG